jgi:hypothetical protein
MVLKLQNQYQETGTLRTRLWQDKAGADTEILPSSVSKREKEL